MTRGGRNTKIHAIVDGPGNPLYVQLTGGQVSDVSMAYELLEHVDVSGSVVMADRAYGAADFRIKIEKSGATYCIPPKSNTAEPWDVDWWQYKERSRVECFSRKSKIIAVLPRDTRNWLRDFPALCIWCVFWSG